MKQFINSCHDAIRCSHVLTRKLRLPIELRVGLHLHRVQPFEPAARDGLVDNARQHVRTRQRTVQSRTRLKRVGGVDIQRSIKANSNDHQPLEPVKVGDGVEHDGSEGGGFDIRGEVGV